MIQQDASLHEKAVQAVATASLPSLRETDRRAEGRTSGDVTFPPERKPRAHARVLATPTRNVRVNADLWGAARTAADGDMRRIIINGENEVIVLNHRK